MIAGIFALLFAPWRAWMLAGLGCALMTDNEKAAIAAGLWGRNCEVGLFRIVNSKSICGCGAVLAGPGEARTGSTHWPPCPDMHDPANLWLALEALAIRGSYVDACFYLASAGPYVRFTIWPKEGKIIDELPPLAESRGLISSQPLFAALVALFDAENAK